MTTEEKTNEFISNMAEVAAKVVVLYKTMTVGAEEVLAVIEDDDVQEAIVTIVTRCTIALERIKKRTEANIDELEARRKEEVKE